MAKKRSVKVYGQSGYKYRETPTIMLKGMIKDERQLRTTNNLGLVGYRAEYHGDRVIAIMKGNEDRPWQCLGIIHPEELSRMVDSGPCVNLDELYKP